MNDDDKITRLGEADIDSLLGYGIATDDDATVEHRLAQAKAAYRKLASDPATAREMDEAFAEADAEINPGGDGNPIFITDCNVTIHLAGRTLRWEPIPSSRHSTHLDEMNDERGRSPVTTRVPTAAYATALALALAVGGVLMGLFGNIGALGLAISTAAPLAIYLVESVFRFYAFRSSLRHKDEAYVANKLLHESEVIRTQYGQDERRVAQS